MTETSLSRRNMLVLTGAGLALAGCKQEAPGTGVTAASSGTCSPLNMYGKDEPYGVEPNLAALPDFKVPDAFPAFTPAYITVVRISAQSAWGLGVNHASFELDEAQKTDRTLREKLAADIIGYLSANPGKRKRLKDSSKGKLYKRQHGKFANETDIVSFAEFGSNQQTEIYVWLDVDENGQPGKHANVQIDPKYLISFSQMTNTSKKALPNDSFFAREVKIVNVYGPIIGIENYFCTFNLKTCKFEKDQPQATGKDPKIYSMNIHYSVPDDDSDLHANSDKRIPMVIDPDTGNGVGFEP